MCNPAIAYVAAMAVATAATAYSANVESKNAQKVANYNAELAQKEADDARARGGSAASQQRQKVRSLLGTQNAQLAGAGIETSSGTALSLATDTAWGGEMDAQQVQINAMREAYGYQTQATSSILQGRAARSNGRTKVGASLLSGAAQAIGGYYTMTK